jgi:hypothetical protein
MIAITREGTLRLYEKNGDGNYHERLAMSVSAELTDTELLDVTTWAQALLDRARLHADTIKVDIVVEKPVKTKPKKAKPELEAPKQKRKYKTERSKTIAASKRFEAPDYMPDLGSVTGRILLILKETPRVSTTFLGEVMRKPTSHMSATITGLRDRGIVAVEQDADNGAWLYSLTEYGLGTVERALVARDGVTDLPSDG